MMIFGAEFIADGSNILYKTSNIPPRSVIVVEILGSILRAQSQQIASEGWQKGRTRTVEVKMTAGKHSDLTGSHGHLAPGCQPLRFDFTILQPAVNCH
jgi:hypothetical protein